MKAKDKTYYQKLVISGQWKKVNKVLMCGSEQEKTWVVETMGLASAQSDECYNQLVDALQHVTEKSAKLTVITALGNSGRSAAMSQLEYMAAHTEDPEIQEAVKAARHTLRETIK